MALKKQAFWQVTFGSSLSGVFVAEDGFDWEGITREEIDITDTTDSNFKKLANRLRNYGTLTCTIFYDPENDYDNYIDTQDTLTITIPITNAVNTTASVITDAASIIGFVPNNERDDVHKAEVTFMFTGTAFSWTPESA
jgi:hypothetical protein